MTKKITPQQLLDAYNSAVASDAQLKYAFPVLAANMEDLTEEQQVQFQHMAFKMNCIVGEMQVEGE